MSDKPKYTPVEMRTLVEVVRCEECKCWDRDDEYCVDFLTQDKNGFCSWWEKREDECGKAQ